MKAFYAKHLSCKDHILIGNNASLVATLCSFRKYDINPVQLKETNLIVFLPKFWLRSVSEDIFDQRFMWGQKLSQLPLDIQSLYKDLMGTYAELITWNDYLTFLQKCTKELELAYGAEVTSLDIYPKLNFEREKSMLTLSDGVAIFRELVFDRPFHIYEWYRKPVLRRMYFLNENDVMTDFSPPTHTSLYEKNPTDMIGKSVIVFGDNESAIWLSTHFKDTKFCFISLVTRTKVMERLQKSGSLRYYYESIPNFDLIRFRDSLFSIGEFRSFYKKYCVAPPIPDKHGGLHLLFQGFSGDVSELALRCAGDMLCVSAIGFLPANDLDDCVARGLERSLTTMLPREFCNWCAPPNIPVGSMAESFMIWHDRTKTLPSFIDKNFYHSKNKRMEKIE